MFSINQNWANVVLITKLQDNRQNDELHKVHFAGDLQENLTCQGLAEIIHNRMNIEVPIEKIDDLYQIANTEKRGRVYKAVFTSLKIKKAVYSARTKLGRENKLFLNEDLTPRREKLAWKARDLRRKRTVANTWTRDGEVFLKEHNAVQAVIATDLLLDEDRPRIKEKGSPTFWDLDINLN